MDSIRDMHTRSIIYNCHREIGLVLAINFFHLKTDAGHGPQGQGSFEPNILAPITL